MGPPAIMLVGERLSCCMQGDVFDPASWRSQLQGAAGVISTLGGFGSNEFMYKAGLDVL